MTKAKAPVKEEPTDEQLGEASYEAYRSARGWVDKSQVRIPAFNELNADDKQHWIAAGTAAYYFGE